MLRSEQKRITRVKLSMVQHHEQFGVDCRGWEFDLQPTLTPDLNKECVLRPSQYFLAHFLIANTVPEQ